MPSVTDSRGQIGNTAPAGRSEFKWRAVLRMDGQEDEDYHKRRMTTHGDFIGAIEALERKVLLERTAAAGGPGSQNFYMEPIRAAVAVRGQSGFTNSD